jgi:hypothetical protein
MLCPSARKPTQSLALTAAAAALALCAPLTFSGAASAATSPLVEPVSATASSSGWDAYCEPLYTWWDHEYDLLNTGSDTSAGFAALNRELVRRETAGLRIPRLPAVTRRWMRRSIILHRRIANAHHGRKTVADQREQDALYRLQTRAIFNTLGGCPGMD